MPFKKLEDISELLNKDNVVVFGTGNVGRIVVQAARDCGITIEKGK